MPPLAYFITFSTYGTWLHGRDAGSVDRDHNAPGTPYVSPDPAREAAQRDAMRQPSYALDEPRRTVVLQTIREVCRHRGWTLHAVHVRSNHVHVVLAAPVPPEKVMANLKAWSSRRLREAYTDPRAGSVSDGETPDRDRWTQHGSTRYHNDPLSVHAAIAYTLDEQGPRMAAFDGRDNEPNDEPEA